MSDTLKYIDRDAALALLPFTAALLSEIDRSLAPLNSGEIGGAKGCLDRLIRINKETRFGRRSWGRLAAGREIDLCVSYKVIDFEVPDPDDTFFFTLDAWKHGTPQAPMLMVSFDRCSGNAPRHSVQVSAGSRVLSRRILSVPLQCVLRHWGNPASGYMIYEHNISAMDHAVPQFQSMSYIGLTSRNWQTRYKEHQRDALVGSELLFHTTLAQVLNKDGVLQAGMGPFELVRAGVCLLSELEYVNLSYDEAMEVEERLVERTLHPKGLNMIPGGLAGIRFLHKLGFLNSGRCSVEDRDFAASKYLLESSRSRGLAPWVSSKWLEDAYYEAVVLKREKTLSREQVLSIRKYGMDWGFAPELIASLSGANLRQVRDVLSGKYYSRVQ